MKKIAAILLLVFLCINSIAQSYQTGHRAITFTDASRSRAVATELYYPATTAGDNVPVAAGSEKFPLVVFGHGFVMPYSAYLWLADSLTKHGFIVAFPTTEGSILPNHERFGRDLAFLCSYIPTLTNDANSFLSGRVIDRKAVAGHSMGGGASFLAMSYNKTIDAIFNFAAAETSPSAKAAALTINKPALVFSGSSDCIVPSATQLDMYNNTPYPCKTYVEITGALHCQFGNNNGNCAFGQITSGCNSTSTSTQTVFEKTVALIVPFLNYYLKDSCNSKNVFEDTYTNMTGASKRRQCASDPFTCSAAVTYIFTGNGNWDDAANWSNGIVPPAVLTAGNTILIDPAGDGECVLNIQQTIATGATLKVVQNKKFRVIGNLDMQ